MATNFVLRYCRHELPATAAPCSLELRIGESEEGRAAVFIPLRPAMKALVDVAKAASSAAIAQAFTPRAAAIQLIKERSLVGRGPWRGGGGEEREREGRGEREMQRAGHKGEGKGGMKTWSLAAKACAGVILASMAFVPVYGAMAMARGYPKAPLVYVGLLGLLAAEGAGRFQLFPAEESEDKED
eukprot:747612-Hanusia_phi.AAC.3